MILLQLIKNTLSDADQKFLDLLQSNQKLFVDFVQIDLAGKVLKGMKWDDLIIRVEWKKRILDLIKF